MEQITTISGKQQKLHSCSFCANPPELCKHLFQPLKGIEGTKPITDAHICDNCVKGAYGQLMAFSAEHNKKTRAANYRLLPNNHKTK